MCLGVPAIVKDVKGYTCTVSSGGTLMNIRCDLLKDIKPGDCVLVHAGFAMQQIDKDLMEQTLKDIEKLLK